ncbi:MAG: peptide-methionine (S)-S-oxide reductase, partial [Bacillota bacterium]
MVSPFEEMPGIVSVVSGYTGGHKPNPTYEEVCSHTTGHTSTNCREIQLYFASFYYS